jgi:basic membrane protein A
MNTDTTRRQRTLRGLAIVGVIAIVVTACSDGEATPTTTAPPPPVTTDTPTTTAPPATNGTPTTPTSGGAPDFNGDGEVVIGVATDGSRNDGAYYQALVERIEAISAAAGYEPPIVVDEIDTADSRAQLRNLAQQNVDVIAIGSENVARDNEELFLEYDEIFWYCNCGSGYQDTPGLLRSADSGAELNISAGYATGLLLEATGGDGVYFLGCCELPFEYESLWGFEFGLSQVDESYTVTYVPTGSFPYDFGNTAGATEAYNNAVAEGADAVYPFLGGAHEAVVQLANEDGLIVMTAGSSQGCERTDLDYDLEVMFDAGDYIEPLFAEILTGSLDEGGARYFTVGVDPQVGAFLCDATVEQEELLEAFNQRIGAGDFADTIDEILNEAYGFDS